MPLSSRIIRDESDFEKLKKPWTELHLQCPRRDVFLTWEWLFAWWKNYGKGKDLFLITVWDGAELVGVAPLMIMPRRKYGKNFKILCNFNSPHADVGGFLFKSYDDPVLESIFQEILRQKRQWDLIELNGFPLECREVSALKDFFKRKKYLSIEESGQHFIVPLTGMWDDYFAGLSQKFRKDINRRLRRIKEAGEIKFQHFGGGQIKWEHFQIIFQINEFGNFPYLYRRSQEQEFQRELLNLMSDRGWLDIQFLYLADVPIAYRYGFVFDNRFEAWRNGFDSRYSQYGPGKILMFLTLQDKHKLQLKEFDFLLGEEPHKEDWMPTVEQFIRLRIASQSNIITALTYFWLPRLKIWWNERRGHPK